MNRRFRNIRTPSVEDINRISALVDPVLRNLQITQCYHELSAVLVERTGSNANWCTFATWASKQAGQTIRKEDLRRIFEDLITTSPESMLAITNVTFQAQRLGAKASSEEIQLALRESIDLPSVVDYASKAVGRGNKKVFEEIGKEFARFYAACLQDAAPLPEAIALFCEGLRTGDPPEGQRYLRQAFLHLYQSLFEVNAKRRAELVLLSNLEIGLHEQTRLQPEIQAAMEGPFFDETQILHRLLSRLFPWTAAAQLRLRWTLMRLLGRPPAIELALRLLLRAARLAARRFVTETMLTIRLSKGIRLRMWNDLAGEFPAFLQELTDPELVSLLEQIDPTHNNLDGSGALDWADLPDRMHFITDLFRLYQQTGELFEPPFRPDQVDALKDGRFPDGPL